MNNVMKSGWLVLLFVFLWAGCAKQERPALVVGTSGEVPPFSWHGPDAGPEVVGFDMAIGQAIAQKARRPLKVEVMPSEELLPAVAAGKVDVALNRLVIPVEMIEGVHFSKPYYQARPAVVVLAGAEAPPAIEDLRDKVIGAHIGFAGVEIARTLTSGENIKTFYSGLAAVVDLMNSQVDAVILDETPANILAEQHPELEWARLDFPAEGYGAAVAATNKQLVKVVNKALAEVVADGRMDQFIEQFLVRRQLPFP